MGHYFSCFTPTYKSLLVFILESNLLAQMNWEKKKKKSLFCLFFFNALHVQDFKWEKNHESPGKEETGWVTTDAPSSSLTSRFTKKIL